MVFKHLEKKDLSYICGLLFFLLIILAAMSFGDDFELVSYFGFAGTLIGIVLAIIALIYSFSQSITQGSANKKLEESAQRLEELSKTFQKLEKLDSLSDELKEPIIQLKNDLQSSILIIDQTVSQLAPALAEKIEKQTELLHSAFNGSAYFNKQPNINTSINDDNVFLERLIQTIPLSHLLITYFCIKSYENGDTTNLLEMLDWSNKNKLSLYYIDDADSTYTDVQKTMLAERNAGAFIGLYIYFASFEWIKLIGDNLNNISLTHLNDEFSDCVKKRVATLVEHHNLKDMVSSYRNYI